MAPNTDIATRALVVALKSPYIAKTTTEIMNITNLSARQINRIYARAFERGFNPDLLYLTIRDEFLQDAPRSGRPTKQTSPI
ncbi:predicted protein [Histoplasma mississippiense (nom. inval.)]|uniref:predicted protein n=1 Tax=Ajellomyces capsulatus (strain NAm1 / WU24) TaxID=2059318 RepID=UPI000157C05F|nr:predicted protein [Histoplasma mississippiense (nom. inval.)]EDN06635.1 predicted protein [Histoplasma mississippiense (nom. inval.)]